MEDMAKENKKLKGKVASIEKDLDRSISIDLKMELKDKDKELLNLLRGFQKLSNMLFNQKSPLFNIWLSGEHHQGEFNKPLAFVQASFAIKTQKEDALKQLVLNGRIS